MPPASQRTDRTAPCVAGMVGALPFVPLLAVLLLALFAGSAGAQETPEETTRGVRVGDGTVSIDGGEVYAEDGCAKAGDVVAGDCDEKGGGEDAGEGTSPDTASPESTATEDTFGGSTVITEEITQLEPTPPEATVPEEADLCPAEPSEEAIKATVSRAVDGDTLELAEEVGGTDEVRLVGVDAPELEGGNGDPEPYAEEAAAFTTERLEGEEVLLEIAEDATDDYGRLLAHVWTDGATGGMLGGLKRTIGMGGPELFNWTLLEEGYAEVLAIEPNGLYAECFEDAEGRAQDEGVGIWGASGSSDEQYGEQTLPGQTVPEGTVLEETDSEDATTEQTLPEETLPEESGGPEDIPGEDPTAGQTPASPSPPATEDSVPEEPHGEDAGRGPVPADDDNRPDRGSYEPAAQNQYADGYDEPAPVQEHPPETEQTVEPADESSPQYDGQDEPALLPATPDPVEPAPTASAPASEPETRSAPTASPAPEAVGLPSRSTPEGSVAVLPETGGPSPGLLAGAFLICCGVGVLAATRRCAGEERRG